MKALREVFLGLITAVASILVVFGAFSIALSEGVRFVTPTAQEVALSTPKPNTPSATDIPFTITVANASTRSETGLSTTASPTVTPTRTVTVTRQPAKAATTCPAPKNWMPYTIQPGDTLNSLSRTFGASASEIKNANCLISDSLLPGTVLYVPQKPAAELTPTATATISFVPCGPPSGWVIYIIQPGDTLFRISLAYNVSVPQLQYANCLGNSTLIRAGQGLYVPNVRTNTPVRTVTATATLTSVPSVAPPASTATLTLAPTSTETLVPTSSMTPEPTSTMTDVPTSTETVTDTP